MHKLRKSWKKSSIPSDTPLVRCYMAMSLNKEETLKCQGSKTFLNNPEVDHSNIQEVLKTFVYIQSKDGNS